MNLLRKFRSWFAWRCVDQVGPIEYWINDLTLERSARSCHVGRIMFTPNQRWLEGETDNPRDRGAWHHLC